MAPVIRRRNRKNRRRIIPGRRASRHDIPGRGIHRAVSPHGIAPCVVADQISLGVGRHVARTVAADLDVAAAYEPTRFNLGAESDEGESGDCECGDPCFHGMAFVGLRLFRRNAPTPIQKIFFCVAMRNRLPSVVDPQKTCGLEFAINPRPAARIRLSFILFRTLEHSVLWKLSSDSRNPPHPPP